MKRRLALPNSVELAILATSSILVAVLCSTLASAPRILPILLFPIILVAMLMGARRTGQLDATPQPAVNPVKATDPTA